MQHPIITGLTGIAHSRQAALNIVVYLSTLTSVVDIVSFCQCSGSPILWHNSLNKPKVCLK